MFDRYLYVQNVWNLVHLYNFYIPNVYLNIFDEYDMGRDPIGLVSFEPLKYIYEKNINVQFTRTI